MSQPDGPLCQPDSMARQVGPCSTGGDTHYLSPVKWQVTAPVLHCRPDGPLVSPVTDSRHVSTCGTVADAMGRQVGSCSVAFIGLVQHMVHCMNSHCTYNFNHRIYKYFWQISTEHWTAIRTFSVCLSYLCTRLLDALFFDSSSTRLCVWTRWSFECDCRLRPWYKWYVFIVWSHTNKQYWSDYYIS